jgi:hypothetical protein
MRFATMAAVVGDLVKFEMTFSMSSLGLTKTMYLMVEMRVENQFTKKMTS